MIRKWTPLTLLAIAIATGFFLTAGGCTKTLPPGGGAIYCETNSPDCLLKNLQVAYRQRDIDPYSQLFAEDFQFHFDHATRDSLGIAVWSRLQDSTATRNLFAAGEVTNIKIDLTYNATPTPVNEIGKENWVRIIVINTDLEVEQLPKPGETEGLTLLVDGQQQFFYFRRGRTPDDTLSTSPTSQRWYIVEWDDQGVTTAPGPPPGDLTGLLHRQ